jgi:hypothetical protein
MNAQLLHATLRRFRRSFLAFFPALTVQDYHTLLAGEGETLLAVLHMRYGCTPGEARGAWNEFVLRHVDGCDDRCTHRPPAKRRAVRARCHPVRMSG